MLIDCKPRKPQKQPENPTRIRLKSWKTSRHSNGKINGNSRCIILFGSASCSLIAFIVITILRFIAWRIYTSDALDSTPFSAQLPASIVFSLAIGTASYVYLIWRSKDPKRLEKPIIFTRMLAFLLGAFLGFGVGVVVFWVVGCVLRLASAVFPGLEWMLPAGGLVAGEHASAAQHARLRPRQEVAPALG